LLKKIHLFAEVNYIRNEYKIHYAKFAIAVFVEVYDIKRKWCTIKTNDLEKKQIRKIIKEPMLKIYVFIKNEFNLQKHER
jgi:hypothetical protein